MVLQRILYYWIFLTTICKTRTQVRYCNWLLVNMYLYNGYHCNGPSDTNMPKWREQYCARPTGPRQSCKIPLQWLVDQCCPLMSIICLIKDQNTKNIIEPNLPCIIRDSRIIYDKTHAQMYKYCTVFIYISFSVSFDILIKKFFSFVEWSFKIIFHVNLCCE